MRSGLGKRITLSKKPLKQRSLGYSIPPRGKSSGLSVRMNTMPNPTKTGGKFGFTAMGERAKRPPRPRARRDKENHDFDNFAPENANFDEEEGTIISSYLGRFKR
jgi:hypothetical protein